MGAKQSDVRMGAFPACQMLRRFPGRRSRGQPRLLHSNLPRLRGRMPRQRPHRLTPYERSPMLVEAQLMACAEACRICATECESLAAMHERCRVCADSCRACEQACRALLHGASFA